MPLPCLAELKQGRGAGAEIHKTIIQFLQKWAKFVDYNQEIWNCSIITRNL